MYRRLLLLGLLAQQEMHGYKLNEFLDRYLRTCSDLKKSTAYFLLQKMAEEGYVSETTDRSGNYPERKVYALTDAGRDHFLRLLRKNLSEFSPAYYQGDVGLAFMHELPAGDRRELLLQRRRGVVETLARLRAAPPHHGSIDFPIGHDVAMLEAELKWLDEAIQRVDQAESLYSSTVAGASSQPGESK